MSELRKENIKIDNREYVDPVKEVIHGKTYFLINASSIHATIIRKLRDIFFLYFYNRKSNCLVYSEGLNIYLDEEDDNTYVIPDIVIVCDSSKFIEDGYRGIPELIVEVLSRKTRSKDRGIKFRLYEKSGVKEYWIIDPKSMSVEQYILKDGRYFLELLVSIEEDNDIEDAEEEESIMKSYVFEGMEVDFNNIF